MSLIEQLKKINDRLESPDKKRKLKRILAITSPDIATMFEMEILSNNINSITEAMEYLTTDKRGSSGDRGEKGEVGERGDTGEPGRDGLDGIDGRNGRDGKDGKNGKDGRDGLSSSNGVDGKQGEKGENGDKGEMPKHEISGNSIRFETSEGTWGNWIHLDRMGEKVLHRGGLGQIAVQALIDASNPPLNGYMAWHQDLGDDEVITAAQYFGYINEDSAWYIVKRLSGAVTYSAGTSSAETNWTGRAALTYTTFDNTTFE